MMFKRRKNAYVLKLRLDSLLCARIGSRRWYTVVALASRPKCHKLEADGSTLPSARRYASVWCRSRVQHGQLRRLVFCDAHRHDGPVHDAVKASRERQGRHEPRPVVHNLPARIAGPGHDQNAAREQERERALTRQAGAGHQEEVDDVTGVGFLRLLATAQERVQRGQLCEPAREGVQDADGERALVDQYEEARTRDSPDGAPGGPSRHTAPWPRSGSGGGEARWWILPVVLLEHDEPPPGVEAAVQDAVPARVGATRRRPACAPRSAPPAHRGGPPSPSVGPAWHGSRPKRQLRSLSSSGSRERARRLIWARYLTTTAGVVSKSDTAYVCIVRPE
jgi:hypothetical protein